MEAREAAEELIVEVRSRRWGVAVAAPDGSDTAVRFEEGDEPLGESTLFEIGSITKTVTGLLLADAVRRNEVALAMTVGDIVGVEAGAATDVTLLELATHRSGLPRLSPNHDVDRDPENPYAAFDDVQLREALRVVEIGSRDFVYSNFGFMLLGWLLEQVARQPYSALFADRVAGPMNLVDAVVAPDEDRRLACYSGAARARWWDQPLPGAGGVAMSIRDVCVYLRAYLDEPLESDLGWSLAHAASPHAGPPDTVGLGWVHEGGGWWHNGGTGGFRTFAAFHRPTRTAVALLANSSSADVVDKAGFKILTTMAGSKTGA